MSLPKKIEAAMTAAVSQLAALLRIQDIDAHTHKALIISGWNDDASTRQAIAQYLVGLRACAIDAALNIRALLEDTSADRLELNKNVIAIVGQNNGDLTDDQKQDDRNPWIAEGIWHLCLVIAVQKPQIHPFGNIVALDYAHIAAKDHGLDIAAIYEADDLLGLSLIESKAYKADPNRAINNAVDFFRSVDKDEQALRIRQSVQIMRMAISEEKQDRIAGSFWKRTRSYIPNPHYDASCLIDWANNRPSFSSLLLGKPNILVMPHVISEFDIFFDNIADEMRNFVRSL